LKGLKTIEERDIALLIDGLRYALFSAQQSFKKLRTVTSNLESFHPTTPSLEDTFDVLANCWQVLDQTYRAQGLFRGLAVLRIKDDETKRFHRLTKTAAGFRNLHHHLKRRVAHLPENMPPVMGSLSWVMTNHPQRCLMLSLDSGSLRFSVPSLSYDRWNECFTSNYVFTAGGESISLEDVSIGCIALTTAIEDWLNKYNVHTSEMVKPVLFSAEVEK
jgi:hypothetical protein